MRQRSVFSKNQPLSFINIGHSNMRGVIVTRTNRIGHSSRSSRNIRSILCPGMAPDALADWTEQVETRFGIWTRSAALCDVTERMAFGALQAAARQEALICGDVYAHDARSTLKRLQVLFPDDLDVAMMEDELID